MSEKQCAQYQMLYITTPFCGVCQSAQPVIAMLAMSLDVPFVKQNVATFINEYDTVELKMTPAVALVYGNDIVYYTEKINNLSDLFQRFEQAKRAFQQKHERASLL